MKTSVNKKDMEVKFQKKTYPLKNLQLDNIIFPTFIFGFRYTTIL